MQNTEIAPTFYTIRLMTEADIPDMVAYLEELDRLEPMEDTPSVEEFIDWYHNPMNREKSYLAYLTKEENREGKIIGNVTFSHNPEDGRAWGWFGVHPDYRLRGLGNDLYNRFVEMARESGARTMQIVPNAKANVLVEFLERRGFELDRYFWAMRLPAEQEVEPPRMPEGFTVRTFVPGQDEPLWQKARNETFADHYGSVARTLEEITHLANEEHFKPEGLFFAFEGDDEEKLAGFCFTGVDPREAERLGYRVGHIHTLGTIPDYRRRGIGRGLLLYGINYLRPHTDVIELGVEGKNRLALPLYEGVGFKHYRSWANMQKAVN